MSDELENIKEDGRKKRLANLELGKWTKGQSGNAAGKPIGTRNRATIIREWLECDADDGGDGNKVDQLVRAVIRKGEGGDLQAFNTIMDSAFGKVAEIHEFSGIGGGPIETASKSVSVTTPATAEEAARAYAELLKKP